MSRDPLTEMAMRNGRAGTKYETLPAPDAAQAVSSEDVVFYQSAPYEPNANPKTLTGRTKLPILSVVPPTALIYLGMAMKYGAFEASKTDGSRGYGPYNWRDQPIEAGIYVDAALRHIMAWWDGTELDADSGKPHLAHALATLAILVDAIENGGLLDNRPRNKAGVAERLIRRETTTNKEPTR